MKSSSGPPPFLIMYNPEGDFLGRKDRCSFILIPPEEQEMERMILENGGQVLKRREDLEAEKEYAVTIVCERFFIHYPQKDSPLPLDTFSSVYIHDCIQSANQGLPLPDLEKFRITPSKYQEYKPEDILWKRKKWLDLLPLAKPKEKRIQRAQELVDILKDCWKKQSEVKPSEPQESEACDVDGSTSVQVAPSVKPSEPQESDAEDLSFGEEEDDFEVAAAAPAPAAPKGTRKKVTGRKYTREEGQKILDLICENNAFMFTKGVKIFQIMELTQHFPGRSYLSLREHWRKKVQPNAIKNSIYHISPADLDKLTNAEKKFQWTKHQNISPDFEF